MLNINETACRICGNTKFKTLLADIKTELGETYSLLQCDNCSFAFTHPLPSSETLKKYYGQNYWSRAGGVGGLLLSTLFKLRSLDIIRQMKKLLPKGARILEWGAGNGDMMRLLNQKDFDCIGIDLYSIKQDDDKLINATIHTAPFEKESFDAITCFHVLEHLSDPLESIKKALILLKPDGILVIEVPNIDSIGFKMFKKNWHPLDIPIHINHFTLKSLQTLFKETGGCHIIKTSYFSHRVSPSSIILSLFPSFDARKMRARFKGRYPFYFMVLYLMLQLAVYPFAYIESLLKKGAVLRLWVCKTELSR